MGQASALAGPAGVASIGLNALGSVMQGKGAKAASEFKADQAQRAADFGKLQAELTGTVQFEKLNTTLAQIDTIRAAGHVDPTSPTTLALEELNKDRSNRQRGAALESIYGQVAQDEASAAYLRKAGDYAVTSSYIGAAGGALGGISNLAFRRRPQAE